jgi:hypothetical protein
MTIPPPVYNPNIPSGPSDSIGKNQSDFLNNFSTLYQAFLKNHVPLDAPSGAGNHTIVQLLDQTSQFQTDLGEISLYANTVSDQTDQLFMQYQGNQTPFQFSNYQLYTLQPINNPTQFFTFLPGNILVYFGMITVKFTSITASVAFNLLPAVAKNIISMNFCPIASGTNPFYPPYVSIQQPDADGIYKTINLFTSNLIPASFPTQFFYCVMVNL